MLYCLSVDVLSMWSAVLSCYGLINITDVVCLVTQHSAVLAWSVGAEVHLVWYNDFICHGWWTVKMFQFSDVTFAISVWTCGLWLVLTFSKLWSRNLQCCLPVLTPPTAILYDSIVKCFTAERKLETSLALSDHFTSVSEGLMAF